MKLYTNFNFCFYLYVTRRNAGRRNAGRRMAGRRKAGQKGCLTGGKQDWRYAEQEGCRKEDILGRNAQRKGCWKKRERTL